MFANMTVVGNLGSEVRKNGEWYTLNIGVRTSSKSETMWVSVKTKQDFVENYPKGARILASGTPAIKVYKDKPDVCIFANTVMNLSPKAQTEGDIRAEYSRPVASIENTDDDVPF